VARQRDERRGRRKRAREALSTGEERYLGRRDKGPVRRFVRDYVDARRSVTELFLPIAGGTVLLSFAGLAIAYIVFLAWMTAAFASLTLMVRGLHRELRQRFGDLQGERPASLTMYAITRATQLRRLRLPKPQVRPGDRI